MDVLSTDVINDDINFRSMWDFHDVNLDADIIPSSLNSFLLSQHRQFHTILQGFTGHWNVTFKLKGEVCSIWTMTVTCRHFILVSHAIDYYSLLYVPVLIHIDYMPLWTLQHVKIPLDEVQCSWCLMYYCINTRFLWHRFVDYDTKIGMLVYNI